MGKQPSSRATPSPSGGQAFEAGQAQQLAGNLMPPSGDDATELGADLRAHLGLQLRALYQEIVTEPVPDRFQRLLEDLAAKKDPA